MHSVSSVEYKIKRKVTFFLVNTKYVSSGAVKISAFHSLRTREKKLVFFTALDEIYLVFTPKEVNILYIFGR